MHKQSLFHISKRDALPWYQRVLIRGGAILLALIVCALVTMLLTGENPISIYGTIFYGAFGTARKSWVTFQNLAVLLGISLAVTPAFKMRFWNIGAEGQVLIGCLATAACMICLGDKLPSGLLILVMLAAALAAGALWGFLPSFFKAKWNTNETLFTLMMNYVAANVVSYFLVVWVPSGSSSLGKLPFGRLPSVVHDYFLIIVVAFVLTIATFVYLNYSKHGYEISVVGTSVRTAQYSGMNVKKIIIRTMIVSGLLCGLTGYLIAAGLDQSITTESVGGQGFTAIMVSWLAHFNPLSMLLTSGLITLLNQGAAQISQDFNVSGAFPDVIVGIILFFIIGSEFFINYKVKLRRRARAVRKEDIK